jgi:nicotinamide mononucleotide transporter
MPTIFDIHTICFSLLGSSVSWVEFIGTLFGLWCVVETAGERVIAWPVGIVNIVFFFILFYQVRLYSDMLLQAYFLLTSIYGWWKWTHPAPEEENTKRELRVTVNSFGQNSVWFAVIAAAALALGSLMGRIHVLLPGWFPEPAAFPFRDAVVTVMSVIAQWFLTRKKLEAWVLWICVDIISVTLFYLKSVHLLALEYLLFFGIAVVGLIRWRVAIAPREEIACGAA